MRSISSGGQPWSVDSVMECEICGVMEEMNASSTFWKRSRLIVS